MPVSSASRSYWRLLNLIDAAKTPFDAEKKSFVETLEVEAVDAASIYEDVVPALAELKSMGIRIFVASSLSRRAVSRFIERNLLGEFLSGVCTRDDAGGVKSAPIINALAGASLAREKAMFLTDTLEGVKTARSAGVHPILMMNDPDEAQRLALHNPAGGIISLHEMPDFLRVIAAQYERAGGKKDGSPG
ncbi:MAG TPA: HAD hydrolase-like protein [Candidatus Acidoferrales bacterium]|nr:HAD hydrolase-like protein [Candidatus Acidoferrales bacterium]